MELNITDQQSWTSDSALSEPHFVEKATLLSAQPVVPISELTVKPGFSRKWLFGVALGGMLFVGVAATSLYYSRFSAAESQPVPQTEPVSSGVEGFASDSVVPVEHPKEPSAVTRSGNPPVDSIRAAMAKTEPRSASSTRPPRDPSNAVSKRPGRRSAEAVIDPRPDFEDEIRYERRAARREAWEERRPRRFHKHSDRRGRIRDIYEGPPRP